MQISIATTLILVAVAAIVCKFTFDREPVDLTLEDLRLGTGASSRQTVPTIPAKIQRLDGKDVRLRGYIYAGTILKASGIKTFFLCRDNNEPPEAVHDSEFVAVRLLGDATIDFTSRPVMVEGTLKILPTPATNGKRRLFYTMDAVEAGPLQ